MSPSLRVALMLALWCVGVSVCAGFSGEQRARRPRAVRLGGVVILTTGWLVPPDMVLARLFAAAFGILACGRALDLARRPGGLSLAARAWFMLAMFDLRQARRVAPRLDLREALWFGVHAAAFSGCWTVIFALEPSLPLRWGAGLALIYCLAELIQSSQLLVYRALGIELPRINDYPLRSRTLAEFWGRRWNRVVSGWLSENLFIPLARRRRAGLGVAAAFVVSAAVHFWLAWIPLDVCAGLTMAAFFVVQGLGLLAERRLGVREWAPAAQRLWTAAWIVLSSPLFVEPGLALLDGFKGSWRATAAILHLG